MSLRGTLALAAAALALGAYVYLAEIRGAAQKAEAEAAAKRMLELPSASVRALELDLSDGQRARLVRDSEKDWKLEAPVTYSADGDTVDRALEVVGKLDSIGVLETRPADLEPFGLGASAKTVEIFTAAAEPIRLRLGGPTPLGGGRYVELGSDPMRLYIVDANALMALEPTLLGVRDKRVARLPAGEVDAIAVTSGGALVARAERVNGVWSLLAPIQAPGDPRAIRRAIDDLALARASGHVDSPRAPADYGLAQPLVEVELRAGERVESLAIGKKDGKVWARRAGDPVLLEVNERVASALPVELFAYRAKRVLEFSGDAAAAVEVAFPRSGETHALVRKGDAWQSSEPGVKMRELKGDDIVFTLASLDAVSLEEQSPDPKALGLDPPAVKIVVKDAKGGTLGELALGDAGLKGVPALSSQSPTLWWVESEIGADVPLSPEAWRNVFAVVTPPPPPPPEPSVPAP